MKYIKQTLLLLLAITTIIACSEDDPFTGISVTAPSNLQMNIQPDADQVGLVNIIPTAEGASYFKLDFGDGSTEDRIDLGQTATHQYAEGTFTITGTAFNVMEDSIQATQTLTVAFDPPSDLILDISIDEVNTNVITVTPSATNAMSYDIFFGDLVDEVPTIIMEGSSVNHSYTEAGDFEVRVIARSGSITTIEATETVSITLPAVQLGFPIDFESDEIDYGLISFGNADLSIIDNPDMNGNASNKVVKFFKANGAEVWAGGLVELPNPIDLSNENNITMDVWSPKSGATVMIKIENSSDPNIFVEVMATTTTSNAWENLTFDFSSADQASDYSKVVVFMDFGNPGDDSDYYFDNITLGEGNGGGGGGEDDIISMPIDFEENINYVFENFGNATTDVLDNPDMSGENVSAKVGNLNKASGSEVWAGSFIDLTGSLDVSAGKTITMKTWSPKAGIQVLLKVENKSDPNIFLEIAATNTLADAWETLSFDFNALDATQDYGRIVVFFDFGNEGDDSNFYFDDITQNN
jgi:hypothetical protein